VDSTCANCGGAIDGNFCSVCGQRRLRADDLSLRHAWRHLVDQMLDVDGRIFRTLATLFKRPGQLTLDFLEGRRAKYIHPLRLFLVFSAIYFVAEGRPYSAMILNSRPMESTLEMMRVKAAREGVPYETMLDRAADRAHLAYKSAFIASVVANGACFWLFFHRRWKYFAEHMVTALHISCIAMTVTLLFGVLGRMFNLEAILSGFAAVGLLTYANIAVRKVYAGERPYTFGVCVALFYMLDIAIVLGTTVLAIYLFAR
jgi:hypothetical protein